MVVNVAIKEGPREKVTSEQGQGGFRKAYRAGADTRGVAHAVTRKYSWNGEISSKISRYPGEGAGEQAEGRVVEASIREVKVGVSEAIVFKKMSHVTRTCM